MNDPTLPERIADRLRRDILRGELAPGASIKERDSAAALGVSRTPLREATRILATEGLVVLRPARSPVVADPSLKEVSDAIVVLRALETLSGRLACEVATEADLAEIRSLHEKMIAGYDRLDPLDLFEIDMAFHLAIVRAAHNPTLAETHRTYLARLWRVRYLSAIQRRSRERVLAQHGAMLDGFARRDAEAVAAEIDRHLAQFLDAVERLYAERETAAADTRHKAGSG